MRAIHRAVTVSVAIPLLAVTLVIGVQGEVSTARESAARVEDRAVQLRGQLRCVDCTLEDVRALSPTSQECLCELAHGDQQVVIEVAPKCASLPYHHVWWRGADDAFATLTARGNLFKQVEITGMLREYPPTSGILDQASVRFVDDQ